MGLALAALCALAPAPALAQSNLPAPIESQALRQLDVWSVSALAPGQGALSSDLWSHSDAEFLATLFDELPAVYESPAMQALALRVLLSGGDAPHGDGEAAGRKRFEALGRMGAADQLATMAAGTGASVNDIFIAQYAAQAELARGRRQEACSRGRGAQFGDQPPAFILRLRAYCAAVGGDRAAADLALEVARAARAEDAWYTGAVAAAGGAPPARPPAARYDNSLSVQLSLAGQLRPGRNSLSNSSTLALVALARSDQAPQPQRAQAAAQALRRGAISATEARTILAATPAETTTGLPPITVALRQVATTTPGSLEAGTAIAGVLRQASSPADFAAAANLFRDDIAALQTAPDQAAALQFARAAVVNGDVQSAQRVLASARGASVSEAALGSLDAALAVAAHNEQATMAVNRRIDAAGASLARGAARDVAILVALGAPADGAAQAFLLANPPQGGVRADPGAMQALTSAVQRGATGEGALLAVAAAGAGGPARLDTDSLTALIRALRDLHLEADARRVAVEALVAGAPG